MRRYFRIALVAILLGASQFAVIAQSVAAPATMTATKSQSEKVTRAQTLLDNWSVDSPATAMPAIEKLLKEAFVVDPQDYFAYRQMARVYMRKAFLPPAGESKESMHARAEEAFKKAQQINPEYVDAYVTAGYFYITVGKLNLAKESLKTAEKLGAADALFFGNLADVDLKQNKYLDAIKNFDKSLNAPGKSIATDKEALVGKSNAYWYLGEKEKYAASLRSIIDLEPNEGWHYGNYATAVLCSFDKYDESIDFFRKALSLKKYGYARRGLAGALYRKSVSNGVPTEQKTKLRNEAKELFEGEPVEILTQICGASSNKAVIAYTSDAAK
jgi:Tfp pilus assembly protein PilF